MLYQRRTILININFQFVEHIFCGLCRLSVAQVSNSAFKHHKTLMISHICIYARNVDFLWRKGFRLNVILFGRFAMVGTESIYIKKAVSSSFESGQSPIIARRDLQVPRSAHRCELIGLSRASEHFHGTIFLWIYGWFQLIRITTYCLVTWCRPGLDHLHSHARCGLWKCLYGAILI